MTECACHGGYCQCLLVDTNCVAVVSLDPYEVELVADPDADNLVVAGPAGLRATTPRLLGNPPATAGVRFASQDSEALLIGGSPTFVRLLDVLWDSRGYVSVVNPKQWVVSEAGVYAAVASMRFDPRFEAMPAGDRQVWCMKNNLQAISSSRIQSPAVPTGSEVEMQLSAPGMAKMDVGDWFSLRVYHGSPTPLKTGSLADEFWAASLSIIRLGGAA